MHGLGREFASGRGRWWFPAALYVLALVAVYLVGTLAGTIEAGEPTLADPVYRPILFPGLFLLAPPLLAAVAAVRGHSPAASLAIGVSAGLGFAVLGTLAAILGTGGNGDSSLWALALTVAGFGLATTVTGHAVGLAARFALERLDREEFNSRSP